MKPHWLDDVEDHDYDAAHQYLTLLLDEHRAHQAILALRKAKVTSRRCNDILRASDREPLPHHDAGVQRALEHIKQRKQLSPILIVSFDHGTDIADGYHRVSATYHTDPFAQIPCRLAHIPDLETTRRCQSRHPSQESPTSSQPPRASSTVIGRGGQKFRRV